MLEPLPNEDLMRCPNCAELIRKDAILCRFCEKGLSDEHFHSCPFCAESIRKEAAFCRFCRSRLHNMESSTTQETIRRQYPSLSERLSKYGIQKTDIYLDAPRQRAFEAIINQAILSADWKEVCAGLMEGNNITIKEIEIELSKRKGQQPKQPWSNIFDTTHRSIFRADRGMKSTEETETPASKFRQLLLSIESSRTTCCIKIVSEKHKSGGAVLIFRGRAIGCKYGNKRLKAPLFGKEAYSCFLADATGRDTDIDSYLLAEDLVLAAASQYHSEKFQIDPTRRSTEIFEAAYRNLIESNMPACIIVESDKEGSIATTYIFGGKIIGVHSDQKGWVGTAYENAMEFVNTPGAKIAAYKLAPVNIDEVMKLTFSLSGMDAIQQ